MANFRGLTYFFFRSDYSSGAIITLSILCAATLIATLWGWEKMGRDNAGPNNKDEFDLAFANTVLFALLVSYHLNPHDLSLLLLPIALLFGRGFGRTSGCAESCELDNLRLARNLVSASAPSLDASSGRVCAHESSLAGLVLERGVSSAARRSWCGRLTELSRTPARRCAPCTARRITAKTNTGKLNVAKKGSFQELIAHARHPSK